MKFYTDVYRVELHEDLIFDDKAYYIIYAFTSGSPIVSKCLHLPEEIYSSIQNNEFNSEAHYTFDREHIIEYIFNSED